METERRLNQSQEEIKRLMDFEKLASAKIHAAESAQKSAEAGLMNMERQVTELKKKLDWEYTSGSQLRVENSQLKDAITEAQAKVQKVEEEAQSYYDQGFNEAADSLQSQLKGECNKYFIQGWHKALNKAGVDDASELYDWRGDINLSGVMCQRSVTRRPERMPLRTRRSLGPMKS